VAVRAEAVEIDQEVGATMLKILVVLLALLVPLPRALADGFSAKNFPGMPQSIDEVDEAKLWLAIEDEDPNCAVNTQTMIDRFYDTAVANQHPRLSFADSGRPAGPAVVITIRTTRISYGLEPLRCLASLSYQFAYFEDYREAPQARIIYQELANLFARAPADSVAPGGDLSRGFSAEVGNTVESIIHLIDHKF
jgi:hypothetical protein